MTTATEPTDDRKLHIFKNDVTDWVIAFSPEDASAVCLEHTGERDEDMYGEPHEWVQLPDDSPLTVNDEDEGKITKTCAEWIREAGRCFFLSTEY